MALLPESARWGIWEAAKLEVMYEQAARHRSSIQLTHGEAETGISTLIRLVHG